MDFSVGSYLVARHTLPFELRAPDREAKALLIVETRPSFFLPYVVASAAATHPGWHLYVFGSPAVHALLAKTCANYDRATRVTLGAHAMSTSQYSHLLLSPRVWSLVREEHVLVFQTDCVLVRPTPDHLLQYDYVGAVCGTLDSNFVMNGGLSLRRRSAMQRAVQLMREQRPDLLDEPEDVAFCKLMRSAGDFELPSMHECNMFAIESLGNAETAVGLHGTDKAYAPPELVAALLASA